MRTLTTTLATLATLVSATAMAGPGTIKVPAEMLAAPQVSTPGSGTGQFVAGPMIAGETAVVAWAGLMPGALVSVGVSTAGADGGPCFDALNVCLDIARPALVGTAIADADGIATIKLEVPTRLGDGTQLFFQAIAMEAHAKPFASSVATIEAGRSGGSGVPASSGCSAFGQTFGARSSDLETAAPTARADVCHRTEEGACMPACEAGPPSKGPKLGASHQARGPSCFLGSAAGRVWPLGGVARPCGSHGRSYGIDVV